MSEALPPFGQLSHDQLREIIRRVIMDVIAQQPKPVRALVLFTGASIGFNEAIGQLRQLKSAGYQLDYLQTESAKHINDQAEIASVGMHDISQKWSGDHDLLIIPTMTVNTVAKVVAGISDTLTTNIIAEFIMRNKRLVAAVNAACPDSREKREWFPNLSDGYAARLRRNLEELASFGVELAPVSKLADTVIGTKDVANLPKVISEHYVRQLAPGTRLLVGKTTVVTALAHESARSLGIRIEREK